MNLGDNCIRISFSEQKSRFEISKAIKIIAKTIKAMRRS